jgi:hypothetical protein
MRESRGFWFGFGFEYEGIEESFGVFVGMATSVDTMWNDGVCFYGDTCGSGVGIATFNA